MNVKYIYIDLWEQPLDEPCVLGKEKETGVKGLKTQLKEICVCWFFFVCVFNAISFNA